MTEKLYYSDSHIKEFEALVTACVEENGKYAVTLDRTAFFPGGGGQDFDAGTIDGVPVLDMCERDGDIVHILPQQLEQGRQVTGKLEWETRLRRMQAHSGEHVVSGIVHALYGYDNVGFHMGEDAITIDFSGELSERQLREVEDRANRAVTANVSVITAFPDPEKLRGMEYRSKLELTENVRIVTIEGYDRCACCAPHVSRTGEIGCIKLLDSMRHRGGVRVRLLCGLDALDDYRRKCENASAVSHALSVPQDEIAAAVEKLLTAQRETGLELLRIKRALLDVKIAALKPAQGNICIFEDSMDEPSHRELVNAGMEKCSGVCAVFCGSAERGYKYIIGSRSMDLRSVSKTINTAIGGRGGGRPEMIQGSASGTKAEIEEFFKSFEGAEK